MPLSSLLLATSLVFSAQARGDTALVVPPSTQVQSFAPADSEWQHLVELGKSRSHVRFAGTGAAITGGGLITIGLLASVMGDLAQAASYSPSDTMPAENSMQTFGAWTIGLGAACEVFATGAFIYSHVLSNRIEAYEHKTRYRLSFHPLILPTDRAVGAVAQVGF